MRTAIDPLSMRHSREKTTHPTCTDPQDTETSTAYFSLPASPGELPPQQFPKSRAAVPVQNELCVS